MMGIWLQGVQKETLLWLNLILMVQKFGKTLLNIRDELNLLLKLLMENILLELILMEKSLGYVK